MLLWYKRNKIVQAMLLQGKKEHISFLTQDHKTLKTSHMEDELMTSLEETVFHNHPFPVRLFGLAF